MQRQRSILALIIAIVIGAIVVINSVPAKLGLDLRGGSQITLQVKPAADSTREIKPEDLVDMQKVIENRINGLGVSEALVQTSGQNQLIVQLPGVTDSQQAERVLGGTALLEFRQEAQKPEILAQLNVRQTELNELLVKQQDLEAKKQAEPNPEAKAKLDTEIVTNQVAITAKAKQASALASQMYESTGLTGRNLKNAYAAPNPQTGAYAIALEFDPQGGELFANMTKSLAGTGRRIGIFLDQDLLSAATVGSEFAPAGITGGRAEITGNFDVKSATEISIKLRGGALPFPVEVVENRTLGATLGRDSIQSSIYAGLGGLVMVLIFMVLYYRLPGLIADVALAIYALLCFAAFKLLGVTLTLPGIAGFILSIGMAVDANILIFERTREELRAGKTLYRSVESGFHRAFSSILDGQVTTLIACASLFWLGAGLVKGFALTLALGVIVNLFTAITCSRTFLLLVLGFPALRKLNYYCPNLETRTPKAGGAL